MLRNRLIYLGALAGAFVFFADYNGWISQFVLLLVICLPMVSLVCCVPSIFNTSVKAAVNRRCPRGSENDIVFSLKAGKVSFAPLCLLTVTVSDKIAGSEFKETASVTKDGNALIPMNTDHSGIYECNVVKCHLYDFLGLFKFPVRSPKSVVVTVEPRPVSPSPCPDFTSISARAMKPKSGGGFSEIHEMREYRPGDPLNSIHWKLSAKTDDLIIREAQEPQKMTVVVTVDLYPDRDKLDFVLDRLLWVTRELVNIGVNHEVRYLDNYSGDPVSFQVASEEDIDRLMGEIMSRPVKYDRPTAAAEIVREADWRWHAGFTGGGEL